MFNEWKFYFNHHSHYNGRILIAWRKNWFTVRIEHDTAQAVTCQVAHTPMQLEFMVTFVYAYNKKEERLDLWNHLKMLSQNCNQAWMVLGDFNAVFQKEKELEEVELH